MKQFFTLCSIVAAIILCCTPLAMAQNNDAPFIDCGQTGASYMSSVVYVGETEVAEFWIRGKNLQGDITFRGYSDLDTEAVFTFEPNTVTKSAAEAGTEMNSPMVNVSITPMAVISGAKYYLEVITEGYTGAPIEIQFPRVAYKAPSFTFYVDNPYEDVFVGKEYTSVLNVKGNEYVQDSVYLIIPENSDILSITPNVLSKEAVSETWGAAVDVRFKPSKATVGDEYARSTFPLIVRTAGMEDQTCYSVECHVKAATPAVEITASMYGQSVYIGETIQKTIKVKGNPFLQGDITLSKVNADDDMTFEPAIVKKADAQTADGANVVVTITPKVSSNGKMAYFYFKASTPGAEDTEANIRVWEVKDKIPEVTLKVPDYIATNGMVGKNYPITIQVIANQYTTSNITLYSNDEDVRGFDPAVVSAEAAKAAGGAPVIVYIRPSVASATEYTKQSFVIKARTEGAAADAEAAIQFAVDANDGTGTDKDPEGLVTSVSTPSTLCNLWSAANTLYVELSETAQVKIYNIAGQCVAETHTSAGTTNFSLPNGMYIVQVNNTTTKVIVK